MTAPYPSALPPHTQKKRPFFLKKKKKIQNCFYVEIPSIPIDK